MDQLLLTFLTWQFLLFCIGLSAIVEVVRRFVEYFEKDVKDLQLWNKLILPVAPVFLGVGFSALIEAYPYPDGIGVSVGARIMFGLTAGLLSGFIYRSIKAVIKSFIKSKDDFSSNEFCPDDSLVSSVRETIQPAPNTENNSDSE